MALDMDAALAPIPVLLTVLLFAVPLLIIFPPVPVSHHDALAQTHSQAGVPEAESRIPESVSLPHDTNDADAAAADAADGRPVVHSL
jgi:hypothetical protein